MNKNKNRTPISGIICNVISCAYNDKDGRCCATQIEVGPMSATSCTQTVCATYKPESEGAEGRIF